MSNHGEAAELTEVQFDASDVTAGHPRRDAEA